LTAAYSRCLSHGIISGALFLCVESSNDRMHTREIGAYGGLVERMPLYAVCFMVFTLANMGLPGTSGFIGEFLTMLGTFQVNTWVVIFAATGTILSAGYMLWLYGRIIFGALVKPALLAIQDLSVREIAILAPLVALTIAFGVYPKPIFDVTSVSVANLVAQHKLAMMDRGEVAHRIVFLPYRGGGASRSEAEGAWRNAIPTPPAVLLRFAPQSTSPTMGEETGGVIVSAHAEAVR